MKEGDKKNSHHDEKERRKEKTGGATRGRNMSERSMQFAANKKMFGLMMKITQNNKTDMQGEKV